MPDTISNRKAILVFLRLLQNEKDKPVFTLHELSVLFGGNSRQAASGHVGRSRSKDEIAVRKRKIIQKSEAFLLTAACGGFKLWT